MEELRKKREEQKRKLGNLGVFFCFCSGFSYSSSSSSSLLLLLLFDRTLVGALPLLFLGIDLVAAKERKSEREGKQEKTNTNKKKKQGGEEANKKKGKKTAEK